TGVSSNARHRGRWGHPTWICRAISGVGTKTAGSVFSGPSWQTRCTSHPFAKSAANLLAMNDSDSLGNVGTTSTIRARDLPFQDAAVLEVAIGIVDAVVHRFVPWLERFRGMAKDHTAMPHRKKPGFPEPSLLAPNPGERLDSPATRLARNPQ